MTLQENLSNNVRSENKNLFAEKIKKTFSIFQLGVAGLDLKVGQKYTVKVELVAKKVNKLKKREVPNIANATSLFPWTIQLDHFSSSK